MANKQTKGQDDGPLRLCADRDLGERKKKDRLSFLPLAVMYEPDLACGQTCFITFLHFFFYPEKEKSNETMMRP